MAKLRTQYVCTDCGHTTAKWMGRCPGCKAWNTMAEEVEQVRPAPVRVAPSLSQDAAPVRLADVPADGGGEVRVRTGIGELDAVLGGGLVAGSLVLVGGDPGVGKSTLLLMAADRFSRRGLDVLYVSGEESVRQIHLRARRLGIEGAHLHLLAHTDFDHIETEARKLRPAVVVVDSVQTVYLPHLDSIPGSVTQVREVAHKAMVMAKSTGTSILLVGHVTKSGNLAGPKVLEHFVDTVLQFESDGRSSLRVLRAVKNRFGPSGELGVFDMIDEGLVEVPDASARLLSERVASAPGTAVVATLEGTRALLAEVQALVGRPSPATPARTCVGVDRNRVLMLTAILGKAGLPVDDRDVFANAAGGVRLDEPAADLGLLAAMASSLLDRPLDPHTVLLGEVGLVGEIRAVTHPRTRLREAGRHGFRRAIVAQGTQVEAPGLELVPVRTVREALAALLPERRQG
ncbi:MAG: DNA repair protein RadA [Alphaproteobacteria bacterium]|nr:DNA repair protein RadA [Alphaproteobacteria bacterium]